MGRRARPEGSIDNIGPDLWLVRLTLGRGARFTRRVHGTRADARAVLDEQVALKRAGHRAVHKRQRFADWVTDYIAEHCPQITQRTRDGYDALLRRYAVPRLGSFYLADISGDQVRRIVAEMTAQRLSPRTIRQFVTVLHTCLAEARRTGRVAANAAADVRLPADGQHEIRTLSPAELGRLQLAASNTPWEALWYVLPDAGLRVAEAMGLKWTDIDKDGVLAVRHTLLRPRGGSWRLGPTKTKRQRPVPLGADTLAALQRLRARQAATRLAAGPDWEDNGLVFTNATGRPAPLRVIQLRHFAPLLRVAGCPHVHMRDLRHTCATQARELGDIKDVSERLGHSDTRVTMQYYMAPSSARQRQLTERLADQRAAFRERAAIK